MCLFSIGNLFEVRLAQAILFGFDEPRTVSRQLFKIRFKQNFLTKQIQISDMYIYNRGTNNDSTYVLSLYCLEQRY